MIFVFNHQYEAWQTKVNCANSVLSQLFQLLEYQMCCRGEGLSDTSPPSRPHLNTVVTTMEQIGEQNGGKNNEKSIKKMIQKWNIDEKIRGKISRKDSYYYRHIFSKNIWFVCSKRSFCGDKEEYHACGRRTERLD